MEIKQDHTSHHSSRRVAESISADQAASQRPSHQVAVARLIRLLATHPWVFWGGVGSSLVLIALVSLSSLLSPGSPGRVASGAAYGVSANKATSEELSQRHRVPAWLFGAIALTCTAGSLVVSKQLSRAAPIPRHHPVSPRPQRRRAPQRLKPYSAIDAPLPRRPVASQPLLPPQPATPPQPVSAPMIGGMPSFTISPQLAAKPNHRFPHSSQVPLQPPPQPTPVTVVPEAESHPLDWGLASLADALDLRQQRSLDSWLDDPNFDQRQF